MCTESKVQSSDSHSRLINTVAAWVHGLPWHGRMSRKNIEGGEAPNITWKSEHVEKRNCHALICGMPKTSIFLSKWSIEQNCKVWKRWWWSKRKIAHLPSETETSQRTQHRGAKRERYGQHSESHVHNGQAGFFLCHPGGLWSVM